MLPPEGGVPQHWNAAFTRQKRATEEMRPAPQVLYLTYVT
jgi:hypothetical protein